MIKESKVALPIKTLSRFAVGDQIVRYLIDSESQCVGLEIIPRSMGNLVVGRRELLRVHADKGAHAHLSETNGEGRRNYAHS
jgi:hypothetical protein